VDYGLVLEGVEMEFDSMDVYERFQSYKAVVGAMISDSEASFY
jgi:hypothetical protein